MLKAGNPNIFFSSFNLISQTSVKLNYKLNFSIAPINFIGRFGIMHNNFILTGLRADNLNLQAACLC